MFLTIAASGAALLAASLPLWAGRASRRHVGGAPLVEGRRPVVFDSHLIWVVRSMWPHWALAGARF